MDFYKELADRLLQYKSNRQELLIKIQEIYESVGINFPTLERENKVTDIDPFTVFELFNKSSMKKSNRSNIISAMAKSFGISSSVPTSFDSIPVLNNQNATFYDFTGNRGETDIDDLWELFESALAYANAPIQAKRGKLSKYFDLTINKRGNGNSKITMGLYWIAPDSFLNLDQRNTWYILWKISRRTYTNTSACGNKNFFGELFRHVQKTNWRFYKLSRKYFDCRYFCARKIVQAKISCAYPLMMCAYKCGDVVVLQVIQSFDNSLYAENLLKVVNEW